MLAAGNPVRNPPNGLFKTNATQFCFIDRIDKEPSAFIRPPAPRHQACPVSKPQRAVEAILANILKVCIERKLSSMELWRTDEIAPVVLLILFELMMLGLINYTMPI